MLTARNALIYGTVYATDGEFTGKITTTEGQIANFNIDEYGIYAPNSSGKVTVGLYEDGRGLTNSNGYIRLVAGGKKGHSDLHGGKQEDGSNKSSISISSAGNFVVSSTGKVYCEDIQIAGGSITVGSNFSVTSALTPKQAVY